MPCPFTFGNFLYLQFKTIIRYSIRSLICLVINLERKFNFIILYLLRLKLALKLQNPLIHYYILKSQKSNLQFTGYYLQQDLEFIYKILEIFKYHLQVIQFLIPRLDYCFNLLLH